MKNIFMMIFFIVLSTSVFSGNGSVYDFELKNIKGNIIKTDVLKGKVVMVVNIATRCGYTGQLDDIEKLYQKYKDKGLTIIGVPSNDFGGQTPEGDQKIAEFCRLKYNVTFPLISKTPVIGAKSHPFVKHLVESTGGGEIGWNFEKFIINKKGKVIKRLSSSVGPLSPEVEKLIKGAL